MWWQGTASNLQMLSLKWKKKKKKMEKGRRRGSFEMHSNVTAEGLHHQKSKENVVDIAL